MIDPTGTSTTETRTELIREWDPDASVSKKYDALKKEESRLYDHCTAEHSKFVQLAKPLDQEREQLDASAKEKFEENSRLLAHIDNEIKNLQVLANERQRLTSEQQGLMKKLNSDQLVLQEQISKFNQCERKITDNDNRQKELEEEVQELQQRMDNLTRKENENIEEQNLIQLSLNGLQQLIARTAAEFEERRQEFDQEQAKLEETQHLIEKFKLQLQQMEEQMKNIQMEFERLKDEQMQLKLKQADLKKQQEQLQTMIEQLQKMLKEKQDGLMQMQLQIDKYKAKIEEFNQQLQNIWFVSLD